MYDAWQIIEEMSDWLSLGPAKIDFQRRCANRLRAFFEGENALTWEEFEQLPSDDKANLIALQWQGYVSDHLTDAVLEAFLKSRSPALSEEAVAYIHAVRDSRTSLYQVLDFHADQSVILRDLLHGGPTIVADGSLPSYLWQRWSVFGGRLVSFEGRHSISPGISLVTFDEPFSRLIESGVLVGKNLASNAAGRSDYLADVAKNLSNLAFDQWLDEALCEAQLAAEERNKRASRLASMTYLSAPVLGGADELERKLDAAADFKQVDVGWSWVERRKQQEVVIADILFHESKLFACCDSGATSKKIVVRLEALLKPVIGKLRKLKPSEVQAFLARDRGAESPMAVMDTLLMSKEGRQVALEGVLVACHHQVNVVGDRPDHLVKTKEGRERVVVWLRRMESELDRMMPEGAEPFDLMPVWQELGISHLRLGGENHQPKRKAARAIDVGQQTLDLG